MERKINIDGREIPFKATAGTARRYRTRFGRDLLKDMQSLLTATQTSETGGPALTSEALSVFENVAYIMARQADPTIPDDPDEWLDGFEMFSIYEVLPEILALWGDQYVTTVESKKNLVALTAR